MIKVLFVCLGNICRSPMAEAVFAHQVQEAGLEGEIEADSAGCGDWHVGAPAHWGTRGVLQEAGIPYSGTARLITPDDLEGFDYVITMDEENLRYVRELESQAVNKKAQVAPLLDFAPIAVKNNVREVPDPYISGGFDVVFRLVYAGCSGLLEQIRREHGF